MRKLLVFAVVIGLLGTAGVALADPNLSDNAVPAHRHFIDTDLSDPTNALVEVGPRYCDNQALKSAFNQFHANLHNHHFVPEAIGPIAPGLHDLSGAELTGRPCSFTG